MVLRARETALKKVKGKKTFENKDKWKKTSPVDLLDILGDR